MIAEEIVRSSLASGLEQDGELSTVVVTRRHIMQARSSSSHLLKTLLFMLALRASDDRAS